MVFRPTLGDHASSVPALDFNKVCVAFDIGANWKRWMLCGKQKD